MKPALPPEQCAICGAEIPITARACPECGADDRTGWREQSLYDGIDLPGTDADSEPEQTGAGMSLIWKATGLVLLVLIAWLFVRGRF